MAVHEKHHYLSVSNGGKKARLKPAKIDVQRSLDSSDIDSDDIDDRTHVTLTPITDKIAAIRLGHTKSQHARKQRINKIRSCSDFWKWYLRKPIAHLPMLYFMLCAIGALLLIVYWWMDNDSAFIVCGGLGLSLSAYSVVKFKHSMAVKQGVDEFKRLNIQLKKQCKSLGAEVGRIKNARKMLTKTRRRLMAANQANMDNLRKFEAVEENMRMAGEKAIDGMSDIYKQSLGIREKWRDEFLNNERHLLQAVYSRYERKHTNRSTMGMNQEDFKEFQNMLPRRYKTRFNRMGTFNALAADDSLIDWQEFSNALDAFAQMEVDAVDAVDTQSGMAKLSLIPRHSRKNANAHQQQLRYFGDIINDAQSDQDDE
eukprot:CAMPEP_0202695596 /NCGR_PEP_ID=MMETSP1385-20130828/9159_1 /ASSEMBLY_ACC=CAM_ASM_000861 /TAXON_ID=933848 /ORGANISM="Elphidium margaritaceum" /LENGTH=369 /DNA_ID=CAMNT_0049351653 /DNA_START=43 /DNA_END=1152 /DNA_ORIENTATION=-